MCFCFKLQETCCKFNKQKDDDVFINPKSAKKVTQPLHSGEEVKVTEHELQVISSDKKKERKSLKQASELFETVDDKIEHDTTIFFKNSQYAVREDEGKVVIKVYRSGDLNGEDFVNFFTMNGTASAGDDYEHTEGVLKVTSHWEN